MSKSKSPTKTKSEPKVIKVSTLVKAGIVALAIIASFVAGVVMADNFNQTVEAKALERVGQIELKLKNNQ